MIVLYSRSDYTWINTVDIELASSTILKQKNFRRGEKNRFFFSVPSPVFIIRATALIPKCLVKSLKCKNYFDTKII